MDISEFKGLVEDWQKDSLKVLENKAHDYAGGSTILSNFLKTANMCNIQPEKVFEVMLSIKMCRLVELLGGKTPRNESVSDTIDDSINYLYLCKAYLVEKANKGKINKHEA